MILLHYLLLSSFICYGLFNGIFRDKPNYINWVSYAQTMSPGYSLLFRSNGLFMTSLAKPKWMHDKDMRCLGKMQTTYRIYRKYVYMETLHHHPRLPSVLSMMTLTLGSYLYLLMAFCRMK